MNLDTIVCADALEFMRTLPDASIDMVLCDLPYQVTSLSWDEIIPFAPMWEQFRRVTKPRAAIVLTASQPFTSKLVMSNVNMFRYEWIWVKSTPTNFANAKLQPLRTCESVLIFGGNQYFPQGLIKIGATRRNSRNAGGQTREGGAFKAGAQYSQEYSNYPKNVLYFDNDNHTTHPTQKPVALFEYLIRTYTQAGDVVLDCCMGSGTTAVAARQCGRHFVGCDSSPKYVELANKRLAKPWQPALLEG